jgi:glycosyltransferase involved in cell wall biosynthesis
MVGSGQYLHGLLGALPQLAPEHRYTVLLPAYRNAERRPTTDDRRPTTDDRRPTTDDRRPTTDDREESGSAFSLQPSAFSLLHTPFDGWNKNLAKLWFEQVAAPLAAARLRADVLHVPYFAPPLWSPAPVVATVLDIVPLRLPDYRGRRSVRAYMRLVAQAARHADQIIAISDHSWGEIVGYLGCPPERVTTVPLAPGGQYAPQDRALAAADVAGRYGIGGPFVYYVGGLDARKNVGTLVRAFARMRAAGGPPATLAIAGRALGGERSLFPDLDALIAEERAGPYVRRIDVPPADNPTLYSAATVFAFPSRYEGFGLPPLEAMACGAPAIVADASSLPEVVGDAALLVPPDDVAAWAAALWRLLADPALREELRRRGLARAAQFSYERTARETLAVYDKLTG